jgi:hypothetical protein
MPTYATLRSVFDSMERQMRWSSSTYLGLSWVTRCRGGMTTGWTITSIALRMKPTRLLGSDIENKIQMSKYIQLSGPLSKKRVRRSRTTMKGSWSSWNASKVMWRKDSSWHTLELVYWTTWGSPLVALQWKLSNELKEVARHCENNCMDASGRKLILHMKKMETAPSKAVV